MRCKSVQRIFGFVTGGKAFHEGLEYGGGFFLPGSAPMTWRLSSLNYVEMMLLLLLGRKEKEEKEEKEKDHGKKTSEVTAKIAIRAPRLNSRTSNL